MQVGGLLDAEKPTPLHCHALVHCVETVGKVLQTRRSRSEHVERGPTTPRTSLLVPRLHDQDEAIPKAGK